MIPKEIAYQQAASRKSDIMGEKVCCIRNKNAGLLDALPADKSSHFTEVYGVLQRKSFLI